MIPQVICVVGPTATGKTKMGVALAHRFGGEVVSVDSMQIYRGMAIGTAAPTPEEMEGIPHHMVGDALHLLRSGGGGADGHAPIDLHGVHRHHLTAEAVGQRHAHFRFSCGSGTHHADDLRDHRRLLSRSFFLLLPPAGRFPGC